MRARGLKPGVMVEIRARRCCADRMLEEVDFLSIGTNDLTQYAMAADRMATELAHLTDPWQPAVLHLIAITAEAGTAAASRSACAGRPPPTRAGGGARRDGHRRLSMASAAVRPVGAQLSRVTMNLPRGRRGSPVRRRPQAGRAAVRALLDGEAAARRVGRLVYSRE